MTIQFKCVFVGASGVGKTTVIHRASYGTFLEETSPTIGASYALTHVTLDGLLYNVELWDTAGQERYAKLVPVYFRNAKLAMVVLDLTQADSLPTAQKWLAEIKEQHPGLIAMLLCNKADLADKRQISQSQIQALAEEFGVEALEVSAKTGQNVSEAFQRSVASLKAKGAFAAENEPQDKLEELGGAPHKRCC